MRNLDFDYDCYCDGTCLDALDCLDRQADLDADERESYYQEYLNDRQYHLDRMADDDDYLEG